MPGGVAVHRRSSLLSAGSSDPNPSWPPSPTTVSCPSAKDGSGTGMMPQVNTYPIVNGANYNAFPGLSKTGNGCQLIVAYRNATSHTSDNGQIVTRTSDDLGATWSIPSTIWNPTLDARDPELFLTSDDRLLCSFFEYDSGSGASSVYVMQSLWGGVSTPVVLSTDSFNRADSTTTLGTTDGSGTLDPLTWTYDYQSGAPGGHAIGVLTNRAYEYNGTGGYVAFAMVDAGKADVELSIKLETQNTYSGGILIRYTNSSTFAVVRTDGNGKPYITKSAGSLGSMTNIVSGSNGDFSAGDTLRVVLSGDGIQVYNGTTLKLSAADPMASTATKHGLMYEASSNTTGHRLDDFQIVDPNGAAVWDAPVGPINGGFTGPTFTSAKMIELADGTLMLPLYGRDSGDSYDSISVVFSTDHGATWGGAVRVIDGQTDGRSYNECCPILFPNGDITIFARTESSPYGMHRFTSTDNGATWTHDTVVLSDMGPGRPTVVRSTAGGGGPLLCHYRRTSSLHAGAATSYDDGATWTYYGSPSDTSNLYFMYASAIEIVPGLFGVAIALETASPTVTNLEFWTYRDGS